MVYNGKPIKMDEIGGYPYLRKPPYKSSMSKALAMPSQYSFLVPRRRGQRTRTDPKLISTRWCPPSYTWIYHCRYRWSMDIPLWISSPVTVEISAINHGEIGVMLTNLDNGSTSANKKTKVKIAEQQRRLFQLCSFWHPGMHSHGEACGKQTQTTAA